jgi:hypothetical protein
VISPTPPRSRGAIRALENAQLAVEQDPVRLELERAQRAKSTSFAKAFRLAPSVEVLEALLRGERVPVSRLDPEWAKAYGLYDCGKDSDAR